MSSNSPLEFAEVVKLPSNRDLFKWVELVNEIRVSTGLTAIEAIQEVRKLVDSGQLQEVYGSALVMFYQNRNISEFEKRQKALQEAWIKADEGKALDVFHEEKRELERSTLVLKKMKSMEQEDTGNIKRNSSSLLFYYFFNIIIIRLIFSIHPSSTFK